MASNDAGSHYNRRRSLEFSARKPPRVCHRRPTSFGALGGHGQRRAITGADSTAWRVICSMGFPRCWRGRIGCRSHQGPLAAEPPFQEARKAKRPVYAWVDAEHSPSRRRHWMDLQLRWLVQLSPCSYPIDICSQGRTAGCPNNNTVLSWLPRAIVH